MDASQDSRELIIFPPLSFLNVHRWASRVENALGPEFRELPLSKAACTAGL